MASGGSIRLAILMVENIGLEYRPVDGEFAVRVKGLTVDENCLSVEVGGTVRSLSKE